MKTKQVVVVGSLNADLVVDVPRSPRPGETLTAFAMARFAGGKGANQACAAARLAVKADLAVSLIGRVGADANGTWLRQTLMEAGVDISAVDTDERAETGVAIIQVAPGGDNQIIVVPGANGMVTVDSIGRHQDLLGKASLILLQLETPVAAVEAAARAGRQSGAVVILDPAPAGLMTDDLLKLADYVTPNESELAALAGVGPTPDVLAQRLIRRGARNVIVKMAAKGALWVSQDRQVHWPAFPVDPVDSTAAGDAFNAAFAVALVEGRSVDEAGRFACAAAAISVTRKGAQPSLPERHEVLRLFESRRS